MKPEFILFALFALEAGSQRAGVIAISVGVQQRRDVDAYA